MFGAEYGSNLENSLVNGYKRLLVKLGALSKINGFSEVIELKYVCTALCAGKVDFRRVNFGKILALQIFTEAALYSFLNFENRAFFGVS